MAAAAQIHNHELRRLVIGRASATPPRWLDSAQPMIFGADELRAVLYATVYEHGTPSADTGPRLSWAAEIIEHAGVGDALTITDQALEVFALSDQHLRLDLSDLQPGEAQLIERSLAHVCDTTSQVATRTGLSRPAARALLAAIPTLRERLRVLP